MDSRSRASAEPDGLPAALISLSDKCPLRRRKTMRAIASAARAFALVLACLALPSFAAYPERPITLIVPWGAGGGTDATARIVGSLLEKELGQPVNVVNRTGGSGVVGHPAISASPPDGYTI